LLLNPICLLKYILKWEQNLFFIFRSGLSDILINCNRIIEGLVYMGTICYYKNVSIYLSMDLYALYWAFAVFSFLILYTVGRTSWTGDQSAVTPLPTRRTIQTQ
jgi:hypothetical protein